MNPSSRTPHSCIWLIALLAVTHVGTTHLSDERKWSKSDQRLITPNVITSDRLKDGRSSEMDLLSHEDHTSTDEWGETSLVDSLTPTSQLSLNGPNVWSVASLTRRKIAKQPDPDSVGNYNPRLNLVKRFLSTGTTIAGVCGSNFCVLGADTRATAGRMVADKFCDKIHYLAPNVYACGAGTSADLDMVTRQCQYSLQLQSTLDQVGNQNSLSSDQTPVSVLGACQFLQNVLFEQNGNCQANLIVGGVYNGQAILRAIHPHGSQDTLVYAALGSGGLAAMSVLESRYRGNMTIDEARQLVMEAIYSGIQNDLGSGSQVDLCVIDERGVASLTRAVVPDEVLPNYEHAVERPGKSLDGPSAGVNGFGNVPFAIQSKRVLVESHARRELQEVKRWNAVLGLT